MIVEESWWSGVEGVRYMVVDCGGGTVDITVHEMDAKTGKLNELHKATGGPHGSTGTEGHLLSVATLHRS